jgi:hypothetical protein
MAKTAQQLRAEKRAQASIAGALRRRNGPASIDRALLSVVRALIPGAQKARQIHELHVKARRAFTRHLRETPAR